MIFGPADADIRRRIRALLETHQTATLATGSSHPWAATVFFASDPALNLYFVSDARTRHGDDLRRDGRVAAAVNRDVGTWDKVLGVQIEGTAAVVEGADREHALGLYLDKFPGVRRLFEQPSGVSERVIATRLRATPFWRLTPRRIRLLDSREGFGWKREITLAD